MSAMVPARSTTVTALLGCAVWLYLLKSDLVAGSPVTASIVLSLAYVISCAWLFRVAPVGLSKVTVGACLLVLVIMCFTGWGLMLNAMPQSFFQHSSPRALRLFSLLFPGPLATIALAAVLVVPVMLLPAGTSWLVPIATLVLVFWVQWNALVRAAQRPFTLAILIYELLCLGALLPAVLIWLAPKVRRKLTNAA